MRVVGYGALFLSGLCASRATRGLDDANQLAVFTSLVAVLVGALLIAWAAE